MSVPMQPQPAAAHSSSSRRGRRERQLTRLQAQLDAITAERDALRRDLDAARREVEAWKAAVDNVAQQAHQQLDARFEGNAIVERRGRRDAVRRIRARVAAALAQPTTANQPGSDAGNTKE